MKSHFNCTIERLRLLLSEFKIKKKKVRYKSVINETYYLDAILIFLFVLRLKRENG